MDENLAKIKAAIADSDDDDDDFDRSDEDDAYGASNIAAKSKPGQGGKQPAIGKQAAKEDDPYKYFMEKAGKHVSESSDISISQDDDKLRQSSKSIGEGLVAQSQKSTGRRPVN